MENYFAGANIAQIAFVVQDVEVSKVKFAKLIGLEEVPPTCGIGTPEVAKTEYFGKPSPSIDCKIAYFNFGNIQIELMEPNEEPSAWRTWLNANGEGLHHLSFFVKNMEEQIAGCEKKGMRLVQRGEFADASGCYAYLASEDTVNFFIELLEVYDEEEQKALLTQMKN